MYWRRFQIISRNWAKGAFSNGAPQMEWLLFLIVGMYALFLLLFLILSLPKKINEQASREELIASFTDNGFLSSANSVLTKSTATYELIFGGDVMLDRGVLAKIHHRGDDSFDFPFEHIKSRVTQADFAMVNLEGPVSSRGRFAGSKYSFRFKPEAAMALKNAGIDAVSLANNHIVDYGRVALCDTIDHLSGVGLYSAGAGCSEEEANRPLVFTLGDNRIGVVSYTEYLRHATASGERAGVSNFDRDAVRGVVENLEKDVDIIIASVHFGEEYQPIHHKRQEDFSHFLIDVGVDVVVGHHPHVVQDKEIYKDKLIVYSLGNLVFDQYFSPETMRGELLSVEVKSGKVIKASVIPYTLNDDFQPYLPSQ